MPSHTPWSQLARLLCLLHLLRFMLQTECISWHLREVSYLSCGECFWIHKSLTTALEEDYENDSIRSLGHGRADRNRRGAGFRVELERSAPGKASDPKAGAPTD